MDKEGYGFLTFAFNTSSVDYLKLAYLQALNVKATQSNAKYAVVSNITATEMPEKYQETFDHIIYWPSSRPFESEPHALELSPFKETIKLESDLLFTRSIEHWWTAFRLKNICLSTGAKNYLGNVSAVRKYRELFDANNLPDVYNGLMYFRYSQEAHDFFKHAKLLQNNWDMVKRELNKCDEDFPSTDVLYGVVALMMGEEVVSVPSLDFMNFVHMKPEFNGWSDTRSWIETVMNERDGDVIRINNLNQYNPVHYYDKSYATDELIKYYESRRTELLAGS